MNKNELLWVNFMRVVAVFLVIMIHSSAPLLYEYNNISTENWWAGNIYDSLSKTCVPLFFMISGYLLLGRQEPAKVFIVKRVNKVLIPLIFWSIFYMLWKQYYLNSETMSLGSFFGMIFAPTYFHLWFLYALIGLYVYIPILRIIVQNLSREYLYYFVAVWFIAVAIIPLIEKAARIISDIDLKMISGYVGYLVVGHLLGYIQINKQRVIFALIVGFASAIITVVGTAILTIRNDGGFSGYFQGYLTPNVILFSVSTFILLKYLSDRLILSQNQRITLQALGSASFGIYLVHPMVMDVLTQGSVGFSVNVLSANATFNVPLLAIITFGISFTVTVFLRQVPLLRIIVP